MANLLQFFPGGTSIQQLAGQHHTFLPTVDFPRDVQSGARIGQNNVAGSTGLAMKHVLDDSGVLFSSTPGYTGQRMAIQPELLWRDDVTVNLAVPQFSHMGWGTD